MAIDNKSIIDGIGIDKENKYLRLLLTDHLEWKESSNVLREKDHLLLLQEKINAYLVPAEQAPNA